MSMYWQFMWFVLAGFVLGFVVSTLWEWFHFRRERMILRDKRVAELEEQLQALERRQSMADIYDDNAVWLADDDVEVTVPYADMVEPEPATITASTPPRDIDLDMSVGATDERTALDTPENIGAYAAAAGLVAAGIAATDDETDTYDAAADADITEEALIGVVGTPDDAAAAADADIFEDEALDVFHEADFDAAADADVTEGPTRAAVPGMFDAAADADIAEAPWDPHADADITEGARPAAILAAAAVGTVAAVDAAADADIAEEPWDPHADADITQGDVSALVARGEMFDAAEDADITEEAWDPHADADINEGPLPGAILAAAAVGTVAAVDAALDTDEDAAEDADITEGPWDPHADADITEGDVPTDDVPTDDVSTVIVQGAAFDTAASAAADADITEGPLPAGYAAAGYAAVAGEASDEGDGTMLFAAPYEVPPNVEPDISLDDLIETPPLPLAADRVTEIDAFAPEVVPAEDKDEDDEVDPEGDGDVDADGDVDVAPAADLLGTDAAGPNADAAPAGEIPAEETATDEPAPADAQAAADAPLPRPPVTSEEALQELSVEELVNLTVDRLAQAAAKEGGQSLALSPKARAELEALTAELRTVKPAPPSETMDEPAQEAGVPAETAPEEAAQEAMADSAPVEHTDDATVRNTPKSDAPDNLFMIKGIGPAYGTRLYAAGIMTWRQVADADVEELRRIARPLANADVEAWPERARALAEEHSRMDADYAGPVPDDLTKIQGIDHQTMFLLYKAGIVTVDQLSRTSPAALAAALPSSGGATPDYAGWIECAQAHMAQENGDA